ncbi:MAG: ABC transporter ATP-binding protein [Acidimicrobiia bacterium]
MIGAPVPGAPNGNVAVRVRGLTKSYVGVAAVAGIDLDIYEGEIFALLGPNGAGKTTTVEILEGYRTRDSGDVAVLGFDPGRDRAGLAPRIGMALQETAVEPYLTVRETVTMYASFYPHPRAVEEVLELVGLTSTRNERVVHLSGGQKRRLDMAVALAGDPELLFLDEPTTGFDPAARHGAWDIVTNLAALGKTVLLTTHYMDEAEHLAHRVAVMANGLIVAEGSPSTLASRDHAKVRVRFRLPLDVTPPAELLGTVVGDGVHELATDDAVVLLHDLTGWAIAAGVPLDGLEVVRPTLEDVYLSLTRPALEE